MSSEILVICDVVESKKHINHNHWGDLPDLIQQLNDDLASCFNMPFKILAGDDFAAVAKDVGSACKIALYLSEIIWEYKLRIVIVEGEVQGMERADFSLLSGQALMRSTEMFTSLHQKHRYGYYAEVELEHALLSEMVHSRLNLILSHSMNWDAKQKQMFHLFRQGKKQAEVADSMQMSQQYISKTYRKLYFELVSQESDAMIESIEKWSGQNVS